MSERIAVIGCKGMLGRAWRELLDRQQVPSTLLDLPEFDMTDPGSIAASITDDHHAIVNCAAWTDVDGAESNEQAALKLNGEAVAMLADHAKLIGATLVHYSTDYVFNGQAAEPYPVDHPREPINAYGRTKLAGEQAIEASGCEHLLIRTSWLYAPWAKNFVRTMIRLSKERNTLRVVNDQLGRPTSAESLAITSWQLLALEHSGTFHVCDDEQCTWFEFATEIVKATNPKCTVEPCTTDEFPTPAKRPAYSVLDLSKTIEAVGPLPTWQDNLEDVLESIREGV